MRKDPTRPLYEQAEAAHLADPKMNIVKKVLEFIKLVNAKEAYVWDNNTPKTVCENVSKHDLGVLESAFASLRGASLEKNITLRDFFGFCGVFERQKKEDAFLGEMAKFREAFGGRANPDDWREKEIQKNFATPEFQEYFAKALKGGRKATARYWSEIIRRKLGKPLAMRLPYDKNQSAEQIEASE